MIVFLILSIYSVTTSGEDIYIRVSPGHHSEFSKMPNMYHIFTSHVLNQQVNKKHVMFCVCLSDIIHSWILSWSPTSESTRCAQNARRSLLCGCRIDITTWCGRHCTGLMWLRAICANLRPINLPPKIQPRPPGGLFNFQ